MFNAIGDLSLLIGHSPEQSRRGPDARSEVRLAIGPFFLIGAAYRMHPWITLGAASFQSATAARPITTTAPPATPTEDETRLVFFEASPALSVNVPRDEWLPGRLSLGVGYRIDIVDFTRTQTRAPASRA